MRTTKSTMVMEIMINTSLVTLIYHMTIMMMMTMEMMMMMMVVMTMINILLLMIDFAPMDKKNDYFVKRDRQSNGRMKRQTQACKDAMDASKN